MDETTQPVNLDFQPEQQPPVDLSTPDKIPVKPQVASTRAHKAQFGLSNTVSPVTYDDAYDNIVMDESGFRISIAGTLNAQRARQAQERLIQMWNQPGMSMDQVNKMMKDQYNPYDPKTVLEQNFAKKYSDSFYSAFKNKYYTNEEPLTTDSWFDDVLNSLPKATLQTTGVLSKVAMYREMAQHAAEDWDTRVERQGWIPWLADQAKNMFQLYQEAKIRSNVAGILPDGRPWYSGLLGDYEESKIAELLSIQNPSEFHQKLHTLLETVGKDNPALAATLAHTVAGRSTSEKDIQNAFTLFAIPDITTVGKAALTPLKLFGRTTEAAKQAAQALGSTAVRPAAVVAADAVGDTAEAALKQHQVTVNNILLGKAPTFKEAIDSLSTNFRADLAGIASFPSRFGGEVLNRMADRSVLKPLVETLMSRYNIERTPSFIRSETQIKAHQEMIKTLYNGPNSMVLDISNPIKDELHNVWYYRISVGTPTGELFKEPEIVRMAMKTNGHVEMQPARMGFKTKTAEYEINRDGSTLRIKQPGEEPFRLGPTSSKTVFVDPKLMAKVRTVDGPIKLGDIKVGVKTQALDKGESLVFTVPTTDRRFPVYPTNEVPYSTIPAKGLVPVELHNPGHAASYIEHRQAYKDFRVGHEITELTSVGPTRGARLMEWRPGNEPGKFTRLEEFPPSKAKYSLTKMHSDLDGSFDIRSPSGEPIGVVTVHQEGDNLRIARMGAKEGKGSLGTAVTRNLLRQLKDYYPEAKTVSGLRISGARGKAIPLEPFNEEGFYAGGSEVKMNLPDPVKQKGLGFYYELEHYIDETGSIIRDGLTALPETRLPDGFHLSTVKAVANWARTPEEVLSRQENTARHIATHGPSRFLNLISESSKPITKVLRSKQGKDFQRAIKFGQESFDPNLTDEFGRPLKGYFFPSQHDLEDFYQRNIGRLPTVNESVAYFAYKENIEFDRVIRNILTFRNKARTGSSSWQFSAIGPEGRVTSNWIDGVQRSQFPSGEGNVLFINAKAGTEDVVPARSIPPHLRKRWEPMVNGNEAKVIELYDPYQYPLKGFGRVNEEPVRYAVVTHADNRPISWDQVPRRGGGHAIYDYDFWLRQAEMKEDTVAGKNIYIRDKTLYGISNRAQGLILEKRFNAIRLLIKDGKLDEAKALANSAEGSVGHDWDELLGKFQWRKGQNGVKIPPQMDANQEIRLTERNKSIVDMDDRLQKQFEFIDAKGRKQTSFVDGTKSGSLARMAQVEFTGARDANDVFTIADHGTKGNPIFRVEPAQQMDPIPSMNRGLSRVVDSIYKDDMNIYSVEHWLSQFSSWIDPKKINIQSSPYRAFAEGLVNFKTGTPDAVRRMAELTQRMAKDFLGVPSKVDTFLHSAMTQLADSVYTRFGPKVAMIPTALLPYTKDPIAFMKTVTFHAKMGLFSIPQFFTQFMTHSNIWGIAPQHAPAGTLGSLLYGYSRINRNPGIISHMDEIASRLGWKPGEWSEFARELEASGFANTGGEHANLDTYISNRIIQGRFNTFLDWGQAPFRLGASSVRTSAFATAYREFRTANPLGAIDQSARATILDRAALLDHNMSRAGNSMLQKGVLAPAGQFLSYNLRLAEMMWGSRLSLAEKARLFGFSAMLYGVPLGGLGLFGFPAEPIIRNQLIKMGYIPGDNALATIFNEGLPAVIGQAITGNLYDVKKFGDKGIDLLGELINGDKTIWDIMGGAAYSTMAGIWSQTSGFRYMTSLAIQGKGPWQPTLNDFIDPMKEVTSVNAAYRLYMALNIQKWYTKKEQVLAKDVTAADALFMTLTGVGRTEWQDMYLKNSMVKTRDKAQRQISDMAVQSYRRAIESALQGDNEQAQKFFVRANTFLIGSGYPPERYHEFYKHATEGYETLVDKVDWSLFMKDVPTDQREYFAQLYLQMQKLKGR